MLLNRTHIRPRDRAREGCVTEAQRIVQGGTHQRTEDVGGLRDPGGAQDLCRFGDEGDQVVGAVGERGVIGDPVGLGDPHRGAAREVLVEEPLALVDYLVLVHPTTLSDVPEWYRGEALLAVAARVGTTRLIDNTPVLVGPGGGRLDVFSPETTAASAPIR